jgi:hypothetical protein
MDDGARRESLTPMLHPTPRRFHAVALLVGVATAVASTWPVAANLSDHVVDGARLVQPTGTPNWWSANIGADVLTTVWILNWVLHGLVTQPLHLFEANIFYPAPVPLARSEHMFATALLGAPGALLGGPVAAHQTALLLCLTLTVWSTAWVVARWEGSLAAGLAAGVLFATCPVLTQAVAHLQFLGVAYFPLILFWLDRFRGTGHVRWVLAAALALALQMLSGQYLAYAALVVWGVAAAATILAAEHGPRPVLRAVALVGVASGVAAVLILPFVVPYLGLLGPRELPDNTASWVFKLGIFSVGEYVHEWQPTLAWVQLPWPVQVLAAAGLGSLVARKAWARTATLGAIAVIGALLSVGPKPGGLGLYRLLLAIVPGFHTAREPVRWAILPHLVAAMLAGSGTALLVRRLGAAGAVVATAAVGLACAMSWIAPLPLRGLPVGDAVPAAYRYLARCGEGDPLLELPANVAELNVLDAERDYFSTVHWLPILNGRSGYPPLSFAETMSLATYIPDDRAVEALRTSAGLRWVLVHCATSGVALRNALCRPGGWPGPRLREFGDLWLYDLGPVPVLPRAWPRRRPAQGPCT